MRPLYALRQIIDACEDLITRRQLEEWRKDYIEVIGTSTTIHHHALESSVDCLAMQRWYRTRAYRQMGELMADIAGEETVDHSRPEFERINRQVLVLRTAPRGRTK